MRPAEGDGAAIPRVLYTRVVWGRQPALCATSCYSSKEPFGSYGLCSLGSQERTFDRSALVSAGSLTSCGASSVRCARIQCDYSMNGGSTGTNRFGETCDLYWYHNTVGDCSALVILPGHAGLVLPVWSNALTRPSVFCFGEIEKPRKSMWLVGNSPSRCILTLVSSRLSLHACSYVNLLASTELYLSQARFSFLPQPSYQTSCRV